MTKGIADKLRELRAKTGESQEDVSAAIGIAQSAYGRYEAGKRVPRSEILAALADHFGVSSDYLMGATESPLPANAYPVSNLAHVPIVGAIRGGPGGTAVQDVEGYGLEDVKNPDEFILLRVTGDSMEPEIHVGDMALIHLQDDVESGELAAVIVDGDEGTLKRVVKQGGAVILEAFNPAYRARVFTDGDIATLRIVGKVVKTERKW